MKLKYTNTLYRIINGHTNVVYIYTLTNIGILLISTSVFNDLSSARLTELRLKHDKRTTCLLLFYYIDRAARRGVRINIVLYVLFSSTRASENTINYLKIWLVTIYIITVSLRECGKKQKCIYINNNIGI